MGDKLAGFEAIQSQNDQLKQELVFLQESASQFEMDRQTSESRLNDANADLRLKLEALQNQNQILSSMTSVLDRVTNENRLLEINLETASQTLKVKSDLIEQLEIELLDWKNREQAASESAKVESATEPHLDWPNIQEKIEEIHLLQDQLEDLKANQHQQSSTETERVQEILKENETLKEETRKIRETLESCQTKMEEADAYRLKCEADLTRTHDELVVSRSELERTNDEKHLLESNINSLNQVLLAHSDQIDQFKSERLTLIEELERLRTGIETSQVEASTETHSDDQEAQRLTDENLLLQSKMENLITEHEDQVRLLNNEIEEFKRRVKQNDEAFQRLKNQIEETEIHRRTLETELGQLREELETARKRCDELSDSNTRQDEVLSRLQSELEESRLSFSETSDLCQKERIRNQELGQVNELKTKEVHDLLQEIEVLRTRHLTLEGEQSSKSEIEEQLLSLTRESTANREEISHLVEQLEVVRQENDKLNSQISETNAEKDLLRETLKAFQQQREQLVQTVQQKHQEAVNYHAETLRLAKICEELQVKYTEPVWSFESLLSYSFVI